MSADEIMEPRTQSPNNNSVMRSRSRSPIRSNSHSRSLSPRANEDAPERSPRPRDRELPIEPREGSRMRSPRYRSPHASYERRRRRSYSRGRRSPPREFRRREPQSPARPSNVLGIFGLSMDTREVNLEEVFGEFGQIQRVELVRDRRTGTSRGFGFIYYEEVAQAEAAREKTNGMNLNGRNIRVDFSKTSGPHNPTPGHYMGKGREESSYGRDRYSRGGGSYRGSRYRSRSFSRSPPRRSRRSPSPSYRGGFDRRPY